MKSFRKSMLLKAVMVFLGVFFLYSCETDDKIDELDGKAEILRARNGFAPMA